MDSAPPSAYLEHVKCLVLYVFAFISQQIHSQLEMLGRVDIRQHDIVVCSVQQYFTQQLDRLPLGYIVGGDEQGVVSHEKLQSVIKKIHGDKKKKKKYERTEG